MDAQLSEVLWAIAGHLERIAPPEPEANEPQVKTCAPHGWAKGPERLHAYAATLYDDHWAKWLHGCADDWEAERQRAITLEAKLRYAERDRDEALRKLRLARVPTETNCSLPEDIHCPSRICPGCPDTCSHLTKVLPL